MTPELKATPNTNCGYFVYLLANGYNAAIGRIQNVAIRASLGNFVSTKSPPQRLANSNRAASVLLTSPEANGLFFVR